MQLNIIYTAVNNYKSKLTQKELKLKKKYERIIKKLKVDTQVVRKKFNYKCSCKDQARCRNYKLKLSIFA